MPIRSGVCLASALVLLYAAELTSPTRRRALLTVVFIAFGVASWGLWLPPTEAMGDSQYYASDRLRFDLLFHNRIWFSSYLSFALIDAIDSALGRTATSPGDAFAWLAWLFGVSNLVLLGLLAVRDDWSPRSVRYAALVLAAPQALMYFGYREVGFLALSVAVYPLLERSRQGSAAWPLTLAAVLGGVAAALHGFGLIGIGAAILSLLDQPPGRVFRFAAISLACWLVWLIPDVLIFHRPIDAGHATALYFRPLLRPTVVTHRINHPLVYVLGVRDVLASLVLVGAPVMVVALWQRETSPERARLLRYSIGPLLAVVLVWPAQGLAREIDFVLGLYPAIYASLWVAAATRAGSRRAAGLLVLGHAVAWWIFDNLAFVNARLD